VEASMDIIPLEKKELKELLNKGWMTHDAMWFYNCLQECGIEKTNKINRAAVRAMAAVEMKRMQKALGLGNPQTFEELKKLFEISMAIVSGDFMKYRFTFPSENVIRGEWLSCFAYDGIKALGVIDRYECGIMDRIEVWLDTLGLRWEVDPKVTGCMMHTDGVCYRNYKFSFDK
jgi:hypothetical protein